MDLKDRHSYLHEILYALVDHVFVSVKDMNGNTHHVCPNNVDAKVDILAENAELVVTAEAMYQDRAYDFSRTLNTKNYKSFVQGQGKSVANELKRELGFKMLGIS